MSIKLYMDVNIPRAITEGLRLRSVDVLTPQDDGTSRLEDPALLDRSTSLGRVLFSHDDDFLIEGTRRQRGGEDFAGIIYCHQLRATVGEIIDSLELIAKLEQPEALRSQIVYIPF
jgi:predicted nuclease of predicted toxin-antitoxin system